MPDPSDSEYSSCDEANIETTNNDRNTNLIADKLLSKKPEYNKLKKTSAVNRKLKKLISDIIS